ncbi:MAG: hypothetical protein CFK49_10765 [Armatimonadetes bacterium JP3_11]|nr:MAG: hypothetical protein CFK49_10765 [Armatimonadetes bacterium JP3_11]
MHGFGLHAAHFFGDLQTPRLHALREFVCPVAGIFGANFGESDLLQQGFVRHDERGILSRRLE